VIFAIPMELFFKILKLYFTFDVPLTPRHTSDVSHPRPTSLRLGHSFLQAIVDDHSLLFHSVSLATSNDWLRYFEQGKGVLVLDEKKGD
jgi:hypothetical protein